jgi:hypothetical protein
MRRALLVLWLVGLAVGLVACAADDEKTDDAADDGLTLYETFDSLDAIRAHHGVVMNEDDATQIVPGYVGNAFWLGDGNYVRFPAAEYLDEEEGTIEFWVLTKDKWHDNTERQLLHVNGPGNLAVFKEKLTNYPAFAVGGHTLIRAESGQFVGWNAWPQWPSRWTHIAVTWAKLGDEDDQSRLVLYVDGVVHNQFVGYLPELDITGDLVLGTWASGADANCLIDELRVYTREKPYTEFAGYDHQMPERFLPYELLLWPTPHPYGMRPEAGFQINPDTKVIVADADYEALEDALAILQQTLRDTLGFAPDLGPASRFFGEENFIAIGEPGKNGLVAAIAEKRKLPVRLENPGPGGYVLEVYENGMVVAGSDYPGTVHGLMSLIQVLREHAEGYVPAITLVDYPDFPVRAAEWVSAGLLLDDEAKRRIRYFASLKLSHLFLRTPDYLKLDDDVARQRVLEFFTFARNYGLQPVPLIDLLSHAEFIVAECAEAGKDCAADGDPSHYCPCMNYVYDQVVDPALENIVQYLAPAIVHIGHDDVRTLNDDPRCKATQLSPAEIFANDVNHAYDLLKALDPTIHVWMWADMIDPLHNGARLTEPADYEGAPAPPPILDLIPHDLAFNLWFYAPVDVATYIIALLSLRGFEDGFLPYYTAGPVGDDIPGALMWVRNAYDMHAMGFLFRPRTDPRGPGDLSDSGWDGLTAANEFSWSLFVPQDVNDVWYDFAYTNRNYGGF